MKINWEVWTQGKHTYLVSESSFCKKNPVQTRFNTYYMHVVHQLTACEIVQLKKVRTIS